MGLQDDIKKMRSEGKSDVDVVDALRKQGVKDGVISEALAQSKIKEAVESPDSLDDAPHPDDLPLGEESLADEGVYSSQQSSSGGNAASAGMYGGNSRQDSTSQNNSSQNSGEYVGGGQFGNSQNNLQNATQEYSQPPQQNSDYASQEYAAASSGESYQPYQEAMSSDMINEIAEQIVDEKMAAVVDRLERAINFRTVAEARISNVNERLKRIEKIIDRLQLSLLEKVGEYVSDVHDLKKELEETQKSFVAVQKKHTHHHTHHPQHQHSQHEENRKP